LKLWRQNGMPLYNLIGLNRANFQVITTGQVHADAIP
jgi:hypothetical protein